MHLHGVILGLASFLSIGLFHPLVIRCEYHFSYRCWPVFGMAGAVLLLVSTLVPDIIASAVLGVVGCSCMWSILELFQQKKRVERGWFKANPKHHKTTGNAATDWAGTGVQDTPWTGGRGMDTVQDTRRSGDPTADADGNSAAV